MEHPPASTVSYELAGAALRYLKSRVQLCIAAIILLPALVGCGGGGSAAPVQQPQIPVNVRTAWTDTGVRVTLGQSVTIVSSGTINVGSCNKTSTPCASSPNGLPWTVCANDPPAAFTAPGLACWSLIGRITTSGAPFQLGTSKTFVASASGEFFVGVNDNYYPDNTGEWTVTIAT
jgi:hypothetical protein